MTNQTIARETASRAIPTAPGDGRDAVMSKMRETLAKCANPNGGPLAMAPERIVEYVASLKTRAEEAEAQCAKLLHRARRAENANKKKGGGAT